MLTNRTHWRELLLLAGSQYPIGSYKGYHRLVGARRCSLIQCGALCHVGTYVKWKYIDLLGSACYTGAVYGHWIVPNRRVACDIGVYISL